MADPIDPVLDKKIDDLVKSGEEMDAVETGSSAQSEPIRPLEPPRSFEPAVDISGILGTQTREQLITAGEKAQKEWNTNVHNLATRGRILGENASKPGTAISGDLTRVPEPQKSAMQEKVRKGYGG